MAITTDILATWRRPAAVFRRKLADGPREDRALAVVMGACALFFVAQWPKLSRDAFMLREEGLRGAIPMAEVPSLQALMGINFFTFIFVAPLAFYLIAGIAGVVLRRFEPMMPFFASRMALFWALLCTAPLMLLHGLLSGFLGQVTSVTGVGVLVGLAFLWLWFRLNAVAMAYYRPQSAAQVAP